MIALIDIGGTQIKYGIMHTKTEKSVSLGSVDTKTDMENFNMMDRIAVVIDLITADYPIEGIAISTAGVVNPDQGKIVHANPNIPNYANTPLRELIEKKYDLPCSVENDVNAALLGEIYYGHHKPVDSALMLTIGTGVGGAIFLNQAIYHGYSFSSGEVGYSFIGDRNIEDVASARALVKQVQDQVPDIKVDGFYIFRQLEEGNATVESIFDNYCRELTKVIINQVSLLNPERVILGGGIMEQTEHFRPKLTQLFAELYTNKYAAQRTELEFATLGNKAGMLGAYHHFKKQHLQKA